ncbi:hypothetical protein [Streptomyces sp. NPDC059604]|uniref:hypothetical protein n=1 Tax=Streptomyces sp. NPDC059604 TaxID=3346881 RepID=UPI00367E4CC6
MVDGMYADTAQKVMFTGSHNWSGPALHNNDEAMPRITTPPVIDAFEANSQTTRSVAVRRPWSSRHRSNPQGRSLLPPRLPIIRRSTFRVVT